MSVPYIAVGENVVVSVNVKEKTKSGLYLPSKDLDNRKNIESEDVELEIVSIGDGVKRDIKIGNIIYVDRGYGVPLPPIDEDKKRYIAVPEKYIVAVKN